MTQVHECGLLVVDIQGKLARMVHNSEQLIRNAQRIIRSCNALSVPVVVLEQNPKGLGKTVHEVSQASENAPVCSKHHFNGLAEQEIRDVIRHTGRQRWLLIGIEAHVCVYQTAQGLLDQGYDVDIISDCIGSRQASDTRLAIDNMRHQGMGISSVEMAVFGMLKTCQADAFRQVLGYIK